MNLGLFLVAGTGASYISVQFLSEHKELELVDVQPLGAQALLLIKGPLSSLNSYLKALRTLDLVKSTLLENVPEKVLKAFYHLESSSLKREVVIFETDEIGRSFEFLKRAIDLQASPVDFRMPRTYPTRVSVIVTGLFDEATVDEFVKWDRGQDKVTVIYEPSSLLKSFFEIQIEK